MPRILPRRPFEVADDVAHVVFGRHDLDRHHRLEQDRMRALARRLGSRIDAAISNAGSDEVDLVVRCRRAA